MDDINCALCGIILNNIDRAYGITMGTIDESCNGFFIDDDSDWDIYCPDCMNIIDKLIANYRNENKQ